MTIEATDHGIPTETLTKGDIDIPPEQITFTKADFLDPTPESRLKIQRALARSRNLPAKSNTISEV